MDEVKGATEGVYRWWSLLESSVQSYLRGGEINLVGQGNLIRFQSKHSSVGSRGLSGNVAANCICLRFPQTHRTTPMKARSRWNRNHNFFDHREHPKLYFNFNSITVHFRGCQLWLLLSEIKIYCLRRVSTGMFPFFTHGPWKGKCICAFLVGFLWGLLEYGNLHKHESSSRNQVFRI